MGADLVKVVKKYTGLIPTKDADLASLSVNVEIAWRANPDIKLRWTDVDKYKASITSYITSLNERQGTGGIRRELTQKLAMLDTAINNGISAVKNYLAYKYEKNNATAFYPQFGIERVGKLFLVPRDRNKRLVALALIVNAIVRHGFQDQKYGTAFWQETKTHYDAFLKQAMAVDGMVSNKVSSKNELRKNIVKTNNALLNVLKGNYPDTYTSVIREWGFQKEKY